MNPKVKTSTGYKMARNIYVKESGDWEVLKDFEEDTDAEFSIASGSEFIQNIKFHNGRIYYNSLGIGRGGATLRSRDLSGGDLQSHISLSGGNNDIGDFDFTETHVYYTYRLNGITRLYRGDLPNFDNLEQVGTFQASGFTDGLYIYDGHVYLFLASNLLLRKYTLAGVFVEDITLPGGLGTSSRIRCNIKDNGYIYTINRDSSQIAVFNLDGEYQQGLSIPLPTG